MRQSFTGTVVRADVASDPRAAVSFSTPAGESGQIDLVVVDQSGAAYDLTGATVTLTVQYNKRGVLVKTATLDSPTLGTCHFALAPADTANLFAASYTFDVWVTDASANRYQVLPPTSTLKVTSA